MKLVLAYICSTLLAPFATALVTFISVPIAFLLFFKRSTRFLGYLIAVAFSVAGGVGAVWFASSIFSWFDQSITLLAIALLGVAYLVNDVPRVIRSMARFGQYCDSVGAHTVDAQHEVAKATEQGGKIYGNAVMEWCWLVGDLIGLVLGWKLLFAS